MFSVPHTGTRFVLRLIRSMGLRARYTHRIREARRLVEDGVRVVIPMRDPVLARISTMNRGFTPAAVERRVPPRLFNTVAAWRTRSNIHVYPVPGSLRDIRALAGFLGVVAPEDVDWNPAGTTPDVRRLKDAYTAGHVPDDLVDFVERLDADVGVMLRELGVDAPMIK